MDARLPSGSTTTDTCGSPGGAPRRQAPQGHASPAGRVSPRGYGGHVSGAQTFAQRSSPQPVAALNYITRCLPRAGRARPTRPRDVGAGGYGIGHRRCTANAIVANARRRVSHRNRSSCNATQGRRFTDLCSGQPAHLGRPCAGSDARRMGRWRRRRSLALGPFEPHNARRPRRRQTYDAAARCGGTPRYGFESRRLIWTMPAVCSAKCLLSIDS